MNFYEDKKEFLLFAVIIIFAFLSAVATKIGADSILNIENVLLKNMLSISIAIGLSLFLIYLTFQLAFFVKNRNIVILIISYIFIASFSFLFNFSAFVGWFMTEDYLLNDTLKLQQNLTDLKIRAITEFDIFHGYTTKKDQVESLRLAMIMEEVREDRPGRRWRYYEKNDEYNSASALLKSIENKFDEDKKFVESKFSKAIELLEKARKEKKKRN